MPDTRIKISQLPEANTTTSTDSLPILNSGTTKQIKANTLIVETISKVPRITGTYSYNFNNIKNITTPNTYILLSDDDGKLITMANANSCVITVPTDLSNTFSCSIMQTGDGSITISNTTNSYIYNSANSYTSYGKYSLVSVMGFGVANTFIITGDLQ